MVLSKFDKESIFIEVSLGLKSNNFTPPKLGYLTPLSNVPHLSKSEVNLPTKT